MLTEQQNKNLQVFLSRVTLQGSEVGAFNELLAALFPSTPKVVEPKEQTTEETK